MNSNNAYDLTFITGVINLELEEIISKDGDDSFYYATSVLRGRFELGEELISKNCYYSFCYALHVLKGRFRLGEKAIIKYIHFKYYCDYLVKAMGYSHD